MLKSVRTALEDFVNVVRNFASSEKPFHNPVTAKNGSLLSRKERIKGRIIPQAIAFGVFGFMAATLVMAGQVWIAVAYSALSMVTSAGALAFKRAQKLKHCNNSLEFDAYDFSETEDRTKFMAKYKNHLNFPDNYVALSQQMGLAEVPKIYIGQENGLANANKTSLFKGKPYIILDRFELSTAKQRPDILETCAHELGHLTRPHTRRSIFMIAPIMGAVTCMSLLIGFDLMMTGTVVGIIKGVLLPVTSFAILHIVARKDSQYNEREADRLSAMATGMVRNTAINFHNLADHEAQFEKRFEKTLNSKFKRAVNRLQATHPHNRERAAYFFEFEEKNNEYCQQKSAVFKTQ